MPTRLIRDGLLHSERYWSVSVQAQRFFLHLMLSADDIGCVSVEPIYVRRRCFNKPPSSKALAGLLKELADADLIRLYQEEGKRYAFIPRFRQRMRMHHLRHPEPPPDLYADDDDAEKKIKRCRDFSEQTTDSGPTTDGHPTDSGQLEVEVEVEGEGEGRREGGSEAEELRLRAANRNAGGYMTIALWSVRLGMKQKHGESNEEFRARVVAAAREQGLM